MNHLSQTIVQTIVQTTVRIAALLVVLVILLCWWQGGVDGFVNYPQLPDPTTVTEADPDQAAANQHYAALLLYLQKKPSAAFLEDIKRKFFTESCTVKSMIDMEHVAEMPNGMVF